MSRILTTIRYPNEEIKIALKAKAVTEGFTNIGDFVAFMFNKLYPIKEQISGTVEEMDRELKLEIEERASKEKPDPQRGVQADGDKRCSNSSESSLKTEEKAVISTDEISGAKLLEELENEDNQ